MQAIRLDAPAESEDALSALLFELGTSGIWVKPAAGGVSLFAYFPERPGLAEEIGRALAPFAEARLSPAEVEDVDWVARFREGFRAFDVPPFRIVPSWESERGPRVLVVDPGRAFGTGTHETTRLCLSVLAGLEAPLGRVLDLGTGTGILAVAACRLGAREVFALDLDPDSLFSARLHARLNGVTFHVVQGDLTTAFLPTTRFDLVLANLTSPLLERALPSLLEMATKTLVLSGLLLGEARELQGRLPEPARLEEDGEWGALVLGT